MRTNLKWFNVLLVALVSCGLYSPVALAQEELSDDLSVADIKEAMSLVYAHTTDIAERSVGPLPHRTLWTMLYDINERSIEVKFYLKDGPIDPATGDPSLVFTEPFRFKLKKTGN